MRRRQVRPALGLVISTVLVFACAPAEPARAPDAAATGPDASAEPPTHPAASNVEPNRLEGVTDSGGPQAKQGPPSSATTVASASPPKTREALVEQARAQLLEVGRSDFTNVRDRTSRLLYTLADLASVTQGRSEEPRNVHEIRFQAERIARTDASFVQTIWIERALLAALSVLEESAATPRASELDDWIKTAREAANAIPDHSSLAFDQAPVQDALRATVSAFAAAEMAHGTSTEERTAADHR